MPLVREPVARECGLEGCVVTAANNGGALAMRGEERGGELGEIAGGVAAEEAEGAVAANGGRVALAAGGALVPKHLLEDAEVAAGGRAGEVSRELRDAGVALLEQREDALPARGPEGAWLDEGEGLVDGVLATRAELVLDEHEAIAVAGRQRVVGLERSESVEAGAAVGDGEAVPAGVEEGVAPGEERGGGAEGVGGEGAGVEGVGLRAQALGVGGDALGGGGDDLREAEAQLEIAEQLGGRPGGLAEAAAGAVRGGCAHDGAREGPSDERVHVGLREASRLENAFITTDEFGRRASLLRRASFHELPSSTSFVPSTRART